MNEILVRLDERRRYLIAQGTAQRLALTKNLEPLGIRLAQADRGLAALRFIREHPAAWLVSGVFLIAVLRPGRGAKWLGRGWLGWQLVRRLSGGR